MFIETKVPNDFPTLGLYYLLFRTRLLRETTFTPK